MRTAIFTRWKTQDWYELVDVEATESELEALRQSNTWAEYKLTETDTPSITELL